MFLTVNKSAGNPSYIIIQSFCTRVHRNFSPADRPAQSQCKVDDSSILARQKDRERAIGGAGSSTHTSGPHLVSGHPSLCQLFPAVVYTHLMPPTPVPPILPASRLHGAPWPSCISMLYEQWRGGSGGLGGEVQRQSEHRGRIGQRSEAWATVRINLVCRITAPLSCDQ